jgi:4-hydroxyphenylpyruvate dioxygenase
MRVEQAAINSVSTRHTSLEEGLDAYAGAGFRRVEFVIPQLKGWLAARSVPDLKRLLDSRGIQCIGGFETHLECFGPPDRMRANHETHLANARLLHDLGGGILVVGTDGPELRDAAALDVVGATLRSLANEMGDLKVHLALEFNWSPLVKSLMSAVRAVEAADNPHEGILFDTAHYYTTVSKMEHLTPAAVRWIKHVHINDMQNIPGELSNCNSDRVLPGHGILPLTQIVGTLESSGYQGFFSIEMFNEELWGLPADDAARRCYESLTQLCQ